MSAPWQWTSSNGFAQALGAPLPACEVNLHPRNDVSLAFHERQGFGEVGRQDRDDGAKTVSVMIKPLPAAAGS